MHRKEKELIKLMIMSFCSEQPMLSPWLIYFFLVDLISYFSTKPPPDISP